jgi:GT2 family glycosyltransferase
MISPKVSIVIVNWKTPQLLAGCLDSIRQDKQCENFEIWVVDNASGDESLTILHNDYPEVKVIANEWNRGFSQACNQVIPKATGDYILLLNPDTVVTPGSITALSDFLDGNPDCGAVGPKVLNFDGSLQLACRRAFPDPAASFFRVTYLSRIFPNNPLFARYNFTYADPDCLIEVDALSGSCMMVRRKVVEKVGLLDEDIFMFGEDIDWCWRIKQAKWKVVYNPQAVVYHIHGAASRFRPIGTTIDLHRGMHVFYRKHLARKYWLPFNALVYAAIWLRAAIFIAINWARSLRPNPATQEALITISSKNKEVVSGSLKSRSGN